MSLTNTERDVIKEAIIMIVLLLKNKMLVLSLSLLKSLLQKLSG
jgi:hypothetical protein